MQVGNLGLGRVGQEVSVGDLGLCRAGQGQSSQARNLKYGGVSYDTGGDDGNHADFVGQL